MRRPRKAPCSCSTDPLVTSAAYIFFITDQKGIFHGSPVRGSSLSLSLSEINSQLRSRARHRGSHTLWVPFRCCVAGLDVGYKAGDVETCEHCVCVNLFVSTNTSCAESFCVFVGSV